MPSVVLTTTTTNWQTSMEDDFAIWCYTYMVCWI